MPPFSDKRGHLGRVGKQAASSAGDERRRTVPASFPIGKRPRTVRSRAAEGRTVGRRVVRGKRPRALLPRHLVPSENEPRPPSSRPSPPAPPRCSPPPPRRSSPPARRLPIARRRLAAMASFLKAFKYVPLVPASPPAARPDLSIVPQRIPRPQAHVHPVCLLRRHVRRRRRPRPTSL